MAKQIRGVYACVQTPFKENEDFDPQALRREIDWFIDKGVHGLLMIGTIGEYAQLTMDERKELCKVTVEQANGRIPVMIGVAGAEQSTRETIELSKYAEDAGADVLMIKAPATLGLWGIGLADEMAEKALSSYFGAVSKSVNIPIMLYNYPSTTKIDVTPNVVCSLAEKGYIQLVKESSHQIERVQEIIHMCGDKITFFIGEDDLAFSAFVLGAKGWISSYATIIPEMAVELFELVDKGDTPKAKELWYKMVPLVDCLEVGKGVQLLKYGLALQGVPVGRLRAPRPLLTEAEKEKLKKMLDDLGVQTLEISQCREF
ncbi:putative 2-dehydro-3-deoxy-D-pentonate aldolase YjhH [subsurface metagenome]